MLRLVKRLTWYILLPLNIATGFVVMLAGWLCYCAVVYFKSIHIEIKSRRAGYTRHFSRTVADQYLRENSASFPKFLTWMVTGGPKNGA